ncbi:hypothetical protein [Isoptericola sp. BMS4]|uniref:hypothetical protein n=1 Tax=Isoptericola sp. BMS4 TaxID=2527875 RepID=UPI001421D220|nr:hypothetical protein [Isoptericola sp. BMS4]
MSTNHARDDWTDPRTEEALRRELDTLAGVGATSSGLDGALGGVRSRVRRRRTIKQAGIGATTLVVAGGLVVGGATLLPEPDPLPGPAVTPSPTRTSSPEPSDGATVDGEERGAVALVEDGYQPAWLQGTDLVCGMPADDLPANTLELLDDPALGTVSSADGTDAVRTWRAPTRLTLSAEGSAGERVSAPTLLWAQDGRVVDVGIDTTEGGMDRLGDVERERDAEDSTVTTCAPEHDEEGGADTYTTELPAGEYQVRAYVTVWSADYSRVGLALSEPATVVVADDGSGGGPDSAEPAGADCSADGLDAGRPDLSTLPPTVRGTAEALLDDALGCDDGALVERARADGTSTNFGGRTPAEFFTLPGAEEHDDVYSHLAQLVADTRWSASPADDQGPFTYVWPRVATQEWAGSDEAWQEVVDAGLLDAGEAADMRAGGGYLGWRLGIREDGTWRFFVAGD